MNRLQDNLAILEALRQYLEKYPDMRFHQAMTNLNIIRVEHNPINGMMIVNDYYTEPSEVLKRIVDDSTEEFVSYGWDEFK